MPLRSAAPDISYSSMLERLKAQRSAPTLQADYTIGGGIEANVHKEVAEERERRIEDIEKRLTDLRGHTENVLALAQLKTLAARDFERSR